MSLALALVGAAMVDRSAAEFRSSKADLERVQTEYGLAGAHLEAAAAVVRSNQPGPYHWTFTIDLGWVDAWAEPEKDKLSLSAAAAMQSASFDRLGITDPATLKGKLADAAKSDQFVNVGQLDTAPIWRRCAPMIISPFGESETFVYATRVQPGYSLKPASWRIGELWRIHNTTSTGWRDDRIVRFTGDAQRPVAVVWRRLSRGGGDEGQCESILRGLAGA